MKPARCPRILLSAYQCGPGMGSVSQIGWEWYQRLARRCDVTLVTHSRNRKVLEESGAPVASSKIIYIDTEWLAGSLYRIAKRLFPRSEHAVFMMSSLDFYVYDRDALRLLRKRIASGEHWDLVHSVTPLTTAASTRLHRLGAPLVWGPLNSGLGTPKGFDAILHEDAVWLYPLRALSAIPGALIGTARNAAIILTATRATVKAIPQHYRNRCVPMLENGVDQARFHPQQWPALSKNHALNIVFVGRLVPCKGLPMLLEAMSQVRDEVTVKLTVVGDGPMRTEWEQERERLGLSARVTFKGTLGLGAVAEEMCAAHALCLPSVRESGGAVLLEAMASGRPVIAVDFGGPSEIVDDEVGVLVPPTNWESVVQGLASALRSMANEPDRWHQRADAARRRAEARFSWEAKVDTALEIYRKLLSSPNVRATLSRDAI